MDFKSAGKLYASNWNIYLSTRLNPVKAIFSFHFLLA